MVNCFKYKLIGTELTQFRGLTYVLKCCAWELNVPDRTGFDPSSPDMYLSISKLKCGLLASYAPVLLVFLFFTLYIFKNNMGFKASTSSE